MAGFRVLPIDSELAKKVRSTLKSPQYGHPAHVERATGYGPCRACLKQFRQGEEDRILFTYNPFDSLDSYPSPGPVFIHAESCPRYDAPGSFPEELRSLPLTLEAYGADRWIIARERPSGAEVEKSVERLLRTSGVRYIHVRNTEAGCFIARIESDSGPTESRGNTSPGSRQRETAADSPLRYHGCEFHSGSQGDFAPCVGGYAFLP